MDSYFQDGVKLKGVLHSKGVLHISGEFEGELFSTDHLVIGKEDSSRELSRLLILPTWVRSRVM